MLFRNPSTVSRRVRGGARRGALGLILVLATWACQQESAAPERSTPDSRSHLASVLERGKLTMLCFPVLVSKNVRPRIEVLEQLGVPLSEVRDPAAFEGSDVDLVRGFADELGVELEVVPMTTTYADLVQATAGAHGDLAASSLSITSERLEIVDFSDPIAATWAVVGVPLDSSVSTLEDLIGLSGVGMRGSSQVELFRQSAPADVELNLVDFSIATYAAVVEDEADFLLLDSLAEVGAPVSDEFSSVKVAVRLARTDFGVAFPKGSDLRARFNAYLARRATDEAAAP